MRTVKTTLIAISAICLTFTISVLLNANSAQAASIPPFPMAFWGNVTVDGSPAPVGTVVSAYYGSTLAGQATTTEAGVYGYSDPTKQKLLVGQGSGAITFEFQLAVYNNNVVTTGSSTQTFLAFETGQTINQDLNFTLPPPICGPGCGFGGGGSGPYYTLTLSKNGSGSGSINSAPAGIECGSSCSGSFASGTSVTLTAVADSGSVFTSWNLDSCPGTGTCIVTMPKTITATFGVQTSSPVASSGGGGGGGGGSIPAPIPSPTVSTNSTTTLGQVLGTTTVNGAHPNGTLVLNNGAVYLISSGQLRGFRDPVEYKSYGFDFSLVVPANSADMLLPQGPIMKAMDGTLVLDSSDNRTVYVIGDSGTKRGFVSAALFTQLGYSFKQAVKINLNDYPSGDPIISASNAHPDGTLVLDGKTIWWINSAKKYGFPTMDVFNSYGWTMTKVLKANQADKSLAEGSVLIPRSQAMATGQWLQ